MDVRNEQQMFTNTVYAIMRMRSEILSRLRAGDPQAIDEFTPILIEAYVQSIPLLSKEEIDEIRALYLGEFEFEWFSKIVEAIAHSDGSVVSLEDILRYVNDPKVANAPKYKWKLCETALRNMGSAMPRDEILGVVENLQAKGLFNGVFDLSIAILDNNAVCNAGDVRKWLEYYADPNGPRSATAEMRWDYYANTICRILEKGEREHGLEFRLLYPGVSGEFTGDDVLSWIAELKNAGRYDLAARVEIAAFKHGFLEVELDTVRESIDKGFTMIGMGSIEGGVDLHAYALEHLPPLEFTPAQIDRWMEEATELRKASNAYKLIVAQIHSGAANADMVNHWIIMFRDPDLRGQDVLIAKAALDPKAPVDGLTAERVESWVANVTEEEGQEILCAALETPIGGGISKAAIEDLIERCGKNGKTDSIYAIAETALRVGNDRALSTVNRAFAKYYNQVQQDSGIVGIIDVFSYLNKPQHIHDLFISAVKAGKTSGISSGSVVKWGQRCADAGLPQLAVEMGALAQSTGLDFPGTLGDQWQIACYEATKSVEICTNAIALFKIFRWTPAFTQSRNSSKEVNASFRILVESCENAGITKTIPVTDALEKVRNLLASQSG